MSQLEQRLAELRFINGVEKVEHVRFSSGDQFWVRFNLPLNMKKLEQAVRSRNCELIKFGGLPSKLPRRLSEVLWDGVTHVIVKKINAWGKLTSSLGFEPEGIGKIALDLHSSHQIFMAMNEDGVHLLYDYLDLKYVPPLPPKPVAPPPKSPAPLATKPTGTPPMSPQKPPSPPPTTVQASEKKNAAT